MIGWECVENWVWTTEWKRIEDTLVKCFCVILSTVWRVLLSEFFFYDTKQKNPCLQKGGPKMGNRNSSIGMGRGKMVLNFGTSIPLKFLSRQTVCPVVLHTLEPWLKKYLDLLWLAIQYCHQGYGFLRSVRKECSDSEIRNLAWQYALEGLTI